MNRLHVLLELLSSDLRTGAANNALDIVTLGSNYGLQFTFCGRLTESFASEAIRRGASVSSGHSLMLSKFGIVPYLVNAVAWLRRLRSLNPDIVHLNYLGWAPSLAYAAHLRGTPIVARAGQAYEARNRAHRWIHAYVANCEAHAGSLLASPVAGRVFVTGSILGTERLMPPFVKAREIPAKQFGRVRFLFLGQLVERKGIRVLVDAFARMSPDADLLIVGGDWSESGFPQEIKRRITELGLGERVFLENFRPDAAALFDDCDVFVLPSFSDARPRSIIEAMYMGKPVVATSVGGIPTLIKHGVTGFLVPPSDAESLARALDQLAANPALRTRLGTAAKAWAASEADPAGAAARQAELYRRLARKC